MMTGIPFFRSLRFKIIATIGALALFVSVAGWQISVRLAEREFYRVLSEQFQHNAEVAENVIASIGQVALMWTNHFADDELLPDMVARGDVEGMHARLVKLLAESTADEVIVLDGNGRILLRASDPQRRGDSLMGWNVARKAVMEGTPGVSIVSDMDNFLIFAGRGFKAAGHANAKPQGAVLVGYVINDAFVTNIRKNTDIDITIVRQRAVMASSFNKGERRMASIPLRYTDYQSLLAGNSPIGEITIMGASYLAVARPLRLMEKSMEGSILLTHPKSGLEAVKERFTQWFGMVFIGAFAVTVILGGRLSAKILSPLSELMRRTEAVAAGDYEGKVELSAGGEIGELAWRFNRMLSAIREKDAKLREYSGELERKVAERTEDYRKAKEQAEEATNLKNKYVALVAHDLKAPITAGLGLTQLLEEVAELPENYRHLGRLTRDGFERSLLMIDKVLTLGRFHTGSIELHKERVDARMIAMIAVAAQSYMAAIKEVSVVNMIPEDSWVFADATLFTSVIDNLISNAVKFSHRWGKVEVFTPQGRQTVIAVRDYGEGIPADILPLLFRHDVRTTTKGTGGEMGSGLGLPLSSETMKAHGGTLTVESAVGRGSVFYAELPDNASQGEV